MSQTISKRIFLGPVIDLLCWSLYRGIWKCKVLNKLPVSSSAMEVQDPLSLTTEISQQWNDLGTKLNVLKKSLIFQRLKKMFASLPDPLWDFKSWEYHMPPHDACHLPKEFSSFESRRDF